MYGKHFILQNLLLVDLLLVDLLVVVRLHVLSLILSLWSKLNYLTMIKIMYSTLDKSKNVEIANWYSCGGADDEAYYYTRL